MRWLFSDEIKGKILSGQSVFAQVELQVAADVISSLQHPDSNFQYIPRERCVSCMTRFTVGGAPVVAEYSSGILLLAVSGAAQNNTLIPPIRYTQNLFSTM